MRVPSWFRFHICQRVLVAGPGVGVTRACVFVSLAMMTVRAGVVVLLRVRCEVGVGGFCPVSASLWECMYLAGAGSVAT